MIRIRNLITGQLLDLGSSYSVEIVDQQNNPGLILLPDAVSGSVKLVTAFEEPDVAKNYAAAYGLKLSTLLIPRLDALTVPKSQH